SGESARCLAWRIGGPAVTVCREGERYSRLVPTLSDTEVGARMTRCARTLPYGRWRTLGQLERLVGGPDGQPQRAGLSHSGSVAGRKTACFLDLCSGASPLLTGDVSYVRQADCQQSAA